MKVLFFALLLAVSVECFAPISSPSLKSPVLPSTPASQCLTRLPATVPPSFLVASCLTLLSSPGAVLAEVADSNGEYVYGAVDAPISIGWGVGVLAIATSLLPILLAPGEEAKAEHL